MTEDFEKIRPKVVAELLESYGLPQDKIRMVLDANLYNGDPLQLLSEKDACKLAGISQRTMYSLVNEGGAPEFVVIKGRRYYPRGNIARWARERTFGSMAQAKAAGC